MVLEKIESCILNDLGYIGRLKRRMGIKIQDNLKRESLKIHVLDGVK